jgi:hypothetical protein
MSAFPLPPAAFMGASRRVEAGNMFDWPRQGWAMFRAAPFNWLGMGGVFFLALLLLTSVLAGSGLLLGAALLVILMTPLAAAMLYACAHSPHPALFYRLFSEQPRLVAPIVLLGGLAFLAFLAVGNMLLGLARGILGVFPAAFASDNPASLLIMILLSSFLLLSVCLLIQAVSVIGLFTLLLVMLHAMPIGAAMVAGVAAYQKNLLCFTLFAPMLAGLLFLGLCSLGVGFVALFPILFATLHAAYRDIFVGI